MEYVPCTCYIPNINKNYALPDMHNSCLIIDKYMYNYYYRVLKEFVILLNVENLVYRVFWAIMPETF